MFVVVTVWCQVIIYGSTDVCVFAFAGLRRPFGTALQRKASDWMLWTVSPGEQVTWPSPVKRPSSTAVYLTNKPAAAPTSSSFCASKPATTTKPKKRFRTHRIATEDGITDIENPGLQQAKRMDVHLLGLRWQNLSRPNSHVTNKSQDLGAWTF